MVSLAQTVSKFAVPEPLKPYVEIFYTQEELTIIKALDGLALSEEDLAARIGEEFGGMPDFRHFLRIAYRRDVVSKTAAEDGINYVVSPMTSRVNNCATFERETWEKIPPKDREIIANYHYQNFLEGKSRLSLEQLRKNGNRIMPLAEIIEYLKGYNADVITILPCDCRSKFGSCGHSRNVCISISTELNTPYDRGLGTPVSTDEAVLILEKAEKEGLVHSAEAGAICNCCSCCCYPTRASMDLGLKGKWPLVSYVVEMDRERCVNCGLCVKRCHFDVFTKEAGKILLDADKCWGCGLCVSTCPKTALSLRKLTAEDKN
ncbi:MAG: 4Fe-4S binding protein [Cloacibacillus porcorum]|uniref:ATP-binding protein n=1 Tax=Cloacibacillus porcorum TaxID=1197717 RepID=UPI0023522B46|nr:4Fe-4S binding protein [Cloacibacillus porcorum]MCI5863935.1 4Fe-4S binding protein [Cloacibacillus porcorum]